MSEKSDFKLWLELRLIIREFEDCRITKDEFIQAILDLEYDMGLDSEESQWPDG